MSACSSLEGHVLSSFLFFLDQIALSTILSISISPDDVNDSLDVSDQADTDSAIRHIYMDCGIAQMKHHKPEHQVGF